MEAARIGDILEIRTVVVYLAVVYPQKGRLVDVVFLCFESR